MSVLTISNLATKLRENLKDNPNIFVRKMVSMVSALDYFTVYDDVEDQIDLTQMITGDPLQPGNRGSFQPKANVIDFKARIGKVQNCEIATKFSEANIESLYRSHLAKKRQSKKSNPYDMPFADLMVQKILESGSNSLRRNALYKGALNAAGTTGSDIFDGVLTHIAADIIATNIPAGNIFNGAAITSSNAEAQVNGVRDLVISQNPEYMNEDLVCLMAPENKMHYWENYQANHGSLPYNTSFEKRAIEGLPNCPIIDEIGLVGSDRVIITTRGNLAFMVDSLNKLNELKFWEEHWDLDMGAKFIWNALFWLLPIQ
ncbi:MAG: hypothetical protein AAF487_15125 [Bacteroidota bacterium]